MTRTLLQEPKPLTPVRAMHLDLKGVPPTPDRLVGLLPVIAAGGYNAVLVEWEDTFPWSVDERFRCETAYTPDEVARFYAAAADLGIEIIPLVQCLGHMETFLNPAGYEHLREVPHRCDVLNPLAEGARALVESLVDDVLARTPGVKRFHLGGDEAWTFGTHPDTAAYVAKHGKGALYLHHVEPILGALLARGVRPIVWHDMMRSWDDASLARLAAKADLCLWGYRGDPATMGEHVNAAMAERFAAAGLTLWGATAYKGADGHSADLPDFAIRQENAVGWAGLARRYGFAGLVATAWSRYRTHLVQCEPIDGSLDSLLNVGAVLHDGRPPEAGRSACLAALEDLGELPRFESCRDSLAALAEARRRGWFDLQMLREQLVVETLDPRRRGWLAGEYLRNLRAKLAFADRAADSFRDAFTGLLAPVWIDRYLAERLEPLRNQLDSLSGEVLRLEGTNAQAEQARP